MILIAKKIINIIFSKFGFKIVKAKFRFPQKNPTNGNFALGYNKNDLNLNIGSGGETYPFFINLDLPSDDYKERQKKIDLFHMIYLKINFPMKIIQFQIYSVLMSLSIV